MVSLRYGRLVKRLVLMLMTACLLSICSCSEGGAQPDEQEPVPEGSGFSSVGEDAQSGYTLLVPEEDIVFWVGDNPVSRQELFLYLQPKKEEAEAIYGDKIKDLLLDDEGTTFAEALKDDVMEQVLYTQTVCSQAASLGVSLSEDDMIDVNLCTEDYMAELTEDEIAEYGIDEEIVRKVYQDNQLATKVYESLVLNVDMDVPEDEIRHMVLQYVTVIKFAKDANGKQIAYTDEELSKVRQQTEDFLKEAKKQPNLKAMTVQDAEQAEPDAESSGEGEENDAAEYDVLEIIADREEMTDKLGEELMEKAFSLKKGEYSSVLEDDYAFYILYCEDEADEESTSEEKVRIITERQEELFSSLYGEWEQTIDVKVNWELWESIGW